jgi:hypothetical protein
MAPNIPHLENHVRPTTLILATAIVVAACATPHSSASLVTSVRPTTPSAPTPRPTIEPSSPVVRDWVPINEPGALIMAELDRFAGGAYDVRLRVASPRGIGEPAVVHRLTIPKPYMPELDDPARLSPDGWIAFRVYDPAAELFERWVAVADLASPDLTPAHIVPGGVPTWAPGGVLLTSAQLREPVRELIYRTPDHGLGEPVELGLDGVEPLATVQSIVSTADASGVLAYLARDDSSIPVVVGWDGVASPWDPMDAPAFALGTERPSAADGSTVFSWCAHGEVETCGTIWETVDGDHHPFSFLVFETAWTRDGRALVGLSGSDVVLATLEDGRVVRTRLSTIGEPKDRWDIVGLADDTVYLQDLSRLAVVGFDGSVLKTRIGDALPAAVLP